MALTAEQQPQYDQWLKSLGKAIRTRRKKKHLTQQQLADQSGFSKQCIKDFENGRRAIGTKTLWQLAEGLGTKVNVLVATVRSV